MQKWKKKKHFKPLNKRKQHIGRLSSLRLKEIICAVLSNEWKNVSRETHKDLIWDFVERHVWSNYFFLNERTLETEALAKRGFQTLIELSIVKLKQIQFKIQPRAVCPESGLVNRFVCATHRMLFKMGTCAWFVWLLRVKAFFNFEFSRICS